jgi:predicted Zn-dependent protease
MRDRQMDLRHAETLGQSCSSSRESERRLPTSFVRDTDEAPWDRESECLARGFLRGVEAREPLGPVAFGECILHLFLGVDLAREPGELLFIEAISRDLGEVGPYANHHFLPFALSSRMSAQVTNPAPAKVPLNSSHACEVGVSVSLLHIVPVNAIDQTFLTRLLLCLEERFLYTGQIERSLRIARTTLNSERNQLFLNTLVTKVATARPPEGGYALAITEFDLYKTSHQFVFGDGSDEHRIATVSLRRLHANFDGEERDDNLLFQRALKESVHNLGHAFGLKHCFNSRCAMYYSNSVYETDNKMSHLCESCERKIRANRTTN